ncbi:PREDICTED: nuclear autoantigen Sp-100-like, partial [Rhagoletis zephyria]|uniref:nuclear autoantigen Sp-100-like n=1 Tax=Rhagoletis zephyria TaxID=28612 RepID=UPI000811A0A9
MNPPSSTPQDEATTSTTIENPMSHIPKHDAAPCACGWVPERLKEFMHHQHNQRRLTMDAFVMETEEQGATSMSSMPTYQDPDDSTYAPPLVQEDMDRSTSSQYTERCDCFNFALSTMVRGAKADAKPRGRMTAYAFFVQTCREEHKKKHPDETVIFAEFSRKCAERWK